MTLSEVLAFLSHNCNAAIGYIPINNLCIDSRHIKPGDLFIAIPGATQDGRNYIGQAVTNGTAVVLAEEQGMLPSYSAMTPIIAIKNLAQKVPELATFFYKYPSDKLKVVGITGTNGKTSCSHYIAQLLHAAGQRCGVMGTLGNGLLDDLLPTQLTTADACTVQQQLAQFVQQQAKFVAMEVSSHALLQQRLLGTSFDTAIFTNLSQDHLDYHSTMQDYFAAKSKLFTDYKPKYCVVNFDDAYSQQLLGLIPKSSTVITYSLQNPKADVYLNANKINTPWGSGIVNSPLIADFNQSNLLACIASCALQNISLEQILAAIPALVAVRGRMQKVLIYKQTAPQVIVDYAHTPDALAKALQALRSYSATKLYCIFGCGGDRDRTKRPLMLDAALEYSDHVIITQDNPRTEDPQQIVNDMLAGRSAHNKINIELDRTMAIIQTIRQAKTTDVILIAGKGHEDYQIIGTTKRPFSDFLVAQQALRIKGESV